MISRRSLQLCTAACAAGVLFAAPAHGAPNQVERLSTSDAVCNPLRVRTIKPPTGKVNFSLQGVKINQRIFSAALRRVNAVNAWIDAGVEARDICAFSLGEEDFPKNRKWSMGGARVEPVLPSPRSPKIKAPSTSKATFTFAAKQLGINRRIASVLKLRAAATMTRFTKLTGGNLDATTRVGPGLLTPKLRLTGTAKDNPKPPATLPQITAPSVTPKFTADYMLATQRLAQDAVRQSNAMLDRIDAGLTGDNFKDKAIGGSQIAQ